MNERIKRFQRAIWIVLAVCVGVGILMSVVDSLGFLLVIGPVDSTAIWSLDILIFLLALLVWGAGATAAFTKGWKRVATLVFVLLLEGVFLLTVLFFGFFFSTSPDYIPIYTPAGEVGLVVREEKWLAKVWGGFYLPAAPCLFRQTGITYEARDIWPFAQGCYELEWMEDQAVIHYDTGAGAWETRAVPLS